MKKQYTKAQRILAIIGIVLLVSLYVSALVVAFLRQTELTKQLLAAALFCTVAIPVIIWLFQFFIGKTKKPDLTEEDDE